MKWEAEGLYIPMSCQQCQDAPCMIVCPVKAISRDEKLSRVMVDHNICIGCRSCVAVCPFGAMGFNVIDREKFKKMVDEFYEYKGLDKNGVPKPETLKRLGIENEPSHLL